MTEGEVRTWKDEERRLRASGDRASAVQALRREISKNGTLAARLMLVTMYSTDTGISAEDVDDEIDQVERIASDVDVDAHWELYRAYELRLGCCAPDAKPIRAFHHLVLAATHGDSELDAFAVANHYHHGSLATETNQSEAIRWYEIAHRRGHPSALRQLEAVSKESKEAGSN